MSIVKYLTWTVFSSMILIGSSMVILTVVNLYIKNQDLLEEQEINGKIKSADEHLLLAVGRLNEAREYVGTSQHLLNKASYDEAFIRNRVNAAHLGKPIDSGTNLGFGGSADKGGGGGGGKYHRCLVRPSRNHT